MSSAGFVAAGPGKRRYGAILRLSAPIFVAQVAVLANGVAAHPAQQRRLR